MRPFHVLIVDEDAASAGFLQRTVSGPGRRVEILPCGEKQWWAIRKIEPDLLILDVTTNDLQGWENLHRLQTHRGTRKIPIIAVSAQSDLEYELVDVFDFLAKPVDLPRLLEDIALLEAGGKDAWTGPYPPLTEGDLHLFQDFLVVHSGLHFDRRNMKILEKGIMRRMRAVGLASYQGYLAYLTNYGESRQELKKLLSLLTIGETFFFRFHAHFEALVKNVIPDLMQRRQADRSIRIWSAGCSTGEEPYSLAIALRENFPALAAWDVQILATDINKRALRKAREGVYGERSLRVTDRTLVARYFRRIGNLYQLDSGIRKMVRFHYLNLQTGDFPSRENGTAGVDILFCRNVMIYFGAETIKGIVERFSHCLRSGGHLFLGHAESLAGISARFRRITKDGGFFYLLRSSDESEAEQSSRRYTFEPSHPAPSSLLPTTPSAVPAPRRRQPQATPIADEAVDSANLLKSAGQAFNGEDYKMASRMYDRILAQDGRNIGAMLGKGFVAANDGDYEGALAWCERLLNIDDLCTEAYFLRGLIFDMRDEIGACVREYQKALLLEMSFIMPHYYLSKAYWRLGRTSDARRELGNTIRLLEKAPDEKMIPHSGGLSREVFLEICREDAVRMEQRESGEEERP